MSEPSFAFQRRDACKPRPLHGSPRPHNRLNSANLENIPSFIYIHPLQARDGAAEKCDELERELAEANAELEVTTSNMKSRSSITG